MAFRDNYDNNIKEDFVLSLPCRLIDFIEKLFDHFDKVNLVGYPDNGGIDTIKYDPDTDIYMVGHGAKKFIYNFLT